MTIWTSLSRTCKKKKSESNTSSDLHRESTFSLFASLLTLVNVSGACCQNSSQHPSAFLIICRSLLQMQHPAQTANAVICQTSPFFDSLTYSNVICIQGPQRVLTSPPYFSPFFFIAVTTTSLLPMRMSSL